MKATKYTRETIREMGLTDRGFPQFKVGDTVAVSLRIKEGDKERLQVFEGDVLAIRKKGVASTFTIPKIDSNSVAIERIFPYYSPLIETIKFIRKGKVRRSKLFFMRGRVGRAARVREKIESKKQQVA
jgi:large subunit ribosomal protein L19